jgi:hypothetical protein
MRKERREEGRKEEEGGNYVCPSSLHFLSFRPFQQTSDSLRGSNSHISEAKGTVATYNTFDLCSIWSVSQAPVIAMHIHFTVHVLHSHISHTKSQSSVLCNEDMKWMHRREIVSSVHHRIWSPNLFSCFRNLVLRRILFWYILMLSMGWDYISELRPPTGLFLSPTWYTNMENHGGMILIG